MSKMSRRAAETMVDRAAARLNELSRLESLFGTDRPDETVIRLIRSINGHYYTYAIIRANDRWYGSGARSGPLINGVEWEQLLDWLDASDIVHFDVIAPTAEHSAPRPRGVTASHQSQDLKTDGRGLNPRYDSPRYREDYPGYSGDMAT